MKADISQAKFPHFGSAMGIGAEQTKYRLRRAVPGSEYPEMKRAERWQLLSSHPIEKYEAKCRSKARTLTGVDAFAAD